MAARFRPDCFPSCGGVIEGASSYTWTNDINATTIGYTDYSYPYGDPGDTSILLGNGFGDIYSVDYTGPDYYPVPVPIAGPSPACLATIAAASVAAAEKILTYISNNRGKYGASVLNFIKLFSAGLVSLEPFAFLDGLVALLLGPEFLALLAVAGLAVGVWAAYLACHGGI